MDNIICKATNQPCSDCTYSCENKSNNNKTVDVIMSLEGDFPIILEVVDTNNIHYTFNRKEHYSKVYHNIHVVSGVKLIEY